MDEDYNHGRSSFPFFVKAMHLVKSESSSGLHYLCQSLSNLFKNGQNVIVLYGGGCLYTFHSSAFWLKVFRDINTWIVYARRSIFWKFIFRFKILMFKRVNVESFRFASSDTERFFFFSRVAESMPSMWRTNKPFFYIWCDVVWCLFQNAASAHLERVWGGSVLWLEQNVTQLCIFYSDYIMSFSDSDDRYRFLTRTRMWTCAPQ